MGVGGVQSSCPSAPALHPLLRPVLSWEPSWVAPFSYFRAYACLIAWEAASGLPLPSSPFWPLGHPLTWEEKQELSLGPGQGRGGPNSAPGFRPHKLCISSLATHFFASFSASFDFPLWFLARGSTKHILSDHPLQRERWFSLLWLLVQS